MKINSIKANYTFWKSICDLPKYDDLLKMFCCNSGGIIFSTDNPVVNEIIVVTFINNFNYLEFKVHDLPTYLNGYTYKIDKIYDKKDEIITKLEKYAFKRQFNNILNYISTKFYNGYPFTKFCYPHELIGLIHEL